jgi:hypothetical protein
MQGGYYRRRSGEAKSEADRETLHQRTREEWIKKQAIDAEPIAVADKSEEEPP